MIKFKYTHDNDLIDSLDIEGLDNVLDIKKKICNNKENIDPSNIKLIFLGKILKDNELIKDCGLDEDITLHVIIRKSYTNNTNANNTNTNNTTGNNTTGNNTNVNAIPNLINHFQQGIQNTIQNEEFQNNITNMVSHFQQGIQNTVQDEDFQNNITSIISGMGEIQQNLQNTTQSEEFQNNINNIFNQLQNNMGNINQGGQNSNQYTEEEENKINILLNLNIINNREYIINLLEDNNWDQDLVGGILTAYID
jgi:hypothetical protein